LLPDWVFALCHVYGSGYFFVNDNHHAPCACIQLLNVFEEPLLSDQARIGEGFIESIDRPKLASKYKFFPEARDGLFALTRSDEGTHLLIDPNDDKRAFLVDNHLWEFTEIDFAFIDLLYFMFTGVVDIKYWALPIGAHVGEVKFLKTQKEGWTLSSSKTKKEV
jgi:hypothetical protein